MSVRLEVESLEGERLEVGGEGFHYLVRVRRLGRGDEVELFDGRGRRARAAIESVGAEVLSLRLLEEPLLEERPALRITSLVALIKGERMDHAITKLVELGVEAIWPIASERAVVRLAGERAAARRRRYQRLAGEAARQCGRADVPEINPIGPLAAAAAACRADRKLLFAPVAGAARLRQVLSGSEPPRSVCLATGPEGGFTPAEIEAATERGFVVTGLGPRVLRAETAAIAAAAAVSAILGGLET